MEDNKIKKDAESPVEEQKKTVEVSVEVMSGILQSLEELKKSDASKSEQIEILRQSVSRSRLEQAEERNKPESLPTADLMLYDGKVVVWFEMVKNKYIYNPLSPNTVSGEELVIKLKFLDGSETTVSYGDFFRNKPRVKVIKIGENGVVERDRQGVLEKFPLWVVEFENKNIYDKPLEISMEYINP